MRINWLAGRFSSSGMEYKQGLSLISDDYILLNRHILQIKFPGVRRSHETDLSGDNIIFYTHLDQSDLMAPQGYSIGDYFTRKKEFTLRNKFISEIQKESSDARTGSSSQKIELIGADIGGQRVSLQVSGNVNINGRLQNQSQTQARSTYQQGQSTSFIIDQKQQLNIEGKIGDRISILVDQDSERDFDFENALKIVYTGDEDAVVQKVEAGNVSLSLPGTQFVTFSGKNNGLFGLKALMKLGGLDITTIASVEKGKKEKLSIDGGAQKTENFIKDYEYRRNLYFFLDYDYRSNFYPMINGLFTYNPNRFVGDLEVYKSINIEVAGSVYGRAYVDPSDTLQYTDYTEQRVFQRLELGLDYQVDKNMGYIRLTSQLQENEVLGVTYRTATEAGVTTGEYGDWNRNLADSTNIVLKLIKPQHMVPSHPCWNLEFKNVYYLGSTGINAEGFNLRIVYIHGASGDEERAKEDGQTFLRKFGLDDKDKNGNPTPDDIIDLDNKNIIKLQSGELWLPYLRPFQFAEGDESGARNPNISDIYSCSAMYDTNRSKLSEIIDDTKFKIVYSYENRSAIINLGPMVIEGSEIVTLGNQTLQRGSDYTIDYFSGTLTLLRQDALNPDAQLDVKFEKNQFFQLDKKTILGARAQYDFGDNSFIGGTLLYFSKSVVDEKVDIGYEPMRNFVWDINGRFNQELPFLTRAIDWLPLVSTDQASSITFEGELAQVRPNPNTISNKDTGDPDGVGFIDDFEGSKRITSPPIMRNYWARSAAPLDDNGKAKDVSLQAFTNWFNPYGGVPTKNIWPNKEVSTRAQNNVTEILILSINPQWASGIGKQDPFGLARQAWGGVTYFFPTSYYDQSKTKFIEIWAHGNTGNLHVDLGNISEDQIPDNKLNTEDRPEAGFTTGNDLLDDGEDTGLDGVFDADERVIIYPGTALQDTLYKDDERLKDFNRDLDDPHSDNWKWSETSTVYRYINGTEDNSKDVSGLFPDAEDMNSNYVLDRVNDYFTVEIPLAETDNPFLAGKTLRSNGNPTGWKLYRIPLNEFRKVRADGEISWEDVRACRLWMDNAIEQDSIWIAKIEMVGNEWEELGVAKNENSNFFLSEENFAVSVVNTEDNPDIYDAPKGVQGEYDRINEIRMKEQSLVLNIDGPNGLGPGEIASAKKTLLEELSFITYKKMKLYINGYNLRTRGYIYPDGEQTALQFFIRFGRGGTNEQFYEYRQPVYGGWDKRNEMEIDLDFVTRMKSYNSEEEFPDNDVRPQVYRITRDEEGEIVKRHYREVIDGKYTGKEIIIWGNPAMSRVQQLQLGLINKKYELDDIKDATLPRRYDDAVFGEVWIDELRLSEVRRDPGTAFRSKATLKLADLANVSVSLDHRDADFHTVEERPSLNATGLNTSDNFMAQGSLSLDKFTPSSWGLQLPLSGSYSENSSTPKFIPGTDILTGENAPDSILTRSQSYSFNTSIGKRQGDFWLTKYTIDQMKLSFNAQWRSSSSNQIKEQNSQNYTSRFNFRIPFGRDNYFRPFKFTENMKIVKKLSEIKWFYTPSDFDIALDAAETNSNKIPRLGEATESYDFGLSSRLNFKYRVTENIDLSFGKSMKNDMDEFRYDKLRPIRELNAGVLIDDSENYSAAFTPKLIPWFTPNFNYTANYTWSEPLGSSTKSIDQLSSQNRLSSNVSLELASILESFYTPKSKPASSSSRPSAQTRGRRPTTPEASDSKPVPQSESSQSNKEHKILELLYKGLKKLQAIQVNYSVSETNRNMGRIGTPGILYRMGFEKDPGLDILSEEVGLNRDNVSKNIDASVRTGLNLFSNLNTSFSFNQNKASTLAQGSSGNTMTRDFFPMGETGRDGIPFPTWTVRLSRLEKIKFLSKFVKSLSLDHGFSGKETIVKRDGEEYNSSYKIYFQPLVGISLSLNNNMNGNFRMTQGRTINNKTSGTDIVYESNLSGSIGYEKKGGFTLPLPFIKDLKLENKTNFAVSFDYNESKTLARNSITEGSKFAVQNENRMWKVSPKITYSFTQKVSGSLFFDYSESFNRQTGKRVTRNGGFDINIQIRG